MPLASTIYYYYYTSRLVPAPALTAFFHAKEGLLRAKYHQPCPVAQKEYVRLGRGTRVGMRASRVFLC